MGIIEGIGRCNALVPVGTLPKIFIFFSQHKNMTSSGAGNAFLPGPLMVMFCVDWKKISCKGSNV